MSIDVGTALVRKWAPKFGFAGWRIQVRPIPMDNPDAWGRSFFETNEEWGVIEIPPDGFFPPETLELLVLHELAHGLLELAASEGVLEEQACNRIARLSRGDFTTPLMNEQREAVIGDAWYGVEGEQRDTAEKLDKSKWLAIVADALPTDEREVISALYWEGLTFRQAAERFGVGVATIDRRRASALTKLHRYYIGLDAYAFGDSNG